MCLVNFTVKAKVFSMTSTKYLGTIHDTSLYRTKFKVFITSYNKMN